MKKTKEILALILVFAMIMLSCNFTFAADKLTATTTANGVTVKWEYELDGDNIIKLVCTNISEIAGKVEIPSTIEGKTVTKIGEKAFYECYGMTEVTFPNTLTYIDYKAFMNCTGLKSITIPDKVTATGKSAFEGCTGLKTVNLSKNLTALNNSVFEKCTGLNTIVIPDKVTTIFGASDWSTTVMGAFKECSGLKSILIPESVSTIEKYAFYKASNKFTVYGVKGSYAEEWAKENNYTFDVIANYNPNGSAQGPKVTHIYVTSPEKGTYKSPQTVKIAVIFDKALKGTAPTLKIKFGDGTTRTVKNGVVTNATTLKEKINVGSLDYRSNYVLYSYNIQSDDEGQLQAVSVEGGALTDENGNSAILSCPAITGNAIVANKTGIVINNTENQDKSNDDSKSEKSDSEEPSDPNDSDNGDLTTADKKIPNTGKDIAIFGAIALVIVLGIAGAAKYYKYRDVK